MIIIVRVSQKTSSSSSSSPSCVPPLRRHFSFFAMEVARLMAFLIESRSSLVTT